MSKSLVEKKLDDIMKLIRSSPSTPVPSSSKDSLKLEKTINLEEFKKKLQSVHSKTLKYQSMVHNSVKNTHPKQEDPTDSTSLEMEELDSLARASFKNRTKKDGSEKVIYEDSLDNFQKNQGNHDQGRDDQRELGQNDFDQTDLQKNVPLQSDKQRTVRHFIKQKGEVFKGYSTEIPQTNEQRNPKVRKQYRNAQGYNNQPLNDQLINKQDFSNHKADVSHISIQNKKHGDKWKQKISYKERLKQASLNKKQKFQNKEDSSQPIKKFSNKNEELDQFLYIMYRYALQEGLLTTFTTQKLNTFFQGNASFEDRLNLYIILENLIAPISPETLQNIALYKKDDRIEFVWWQTNPFYIMLGIFIGSVFGFLLLFSLLSFVFFSSSTIIQLSFISLIFGSSIGSVLFVLFRLQYHMVQRSYNKSMKIGAWLDYIFGIIFGSIVSIGLILINDLHHVGLAIWIYQVFSIILGFLSFLFFIILFNILRGILTIFYGNRGEKILWRYSSQKSKNF